MDNKCINTNCRKLISQKALNHGITVCKECRCKFIYKKKYKFRRCKEVDTEYHAHCNNCESVICECCMSCIKCNT
jgi:hypothetical protein